MFRLDASNTDEDGSCPNVQSSSSIGGSCSDGTNWLMHYDVEWSYRWVVPENLGGDGIQTICYWLRWFHGDVCPLLPDGSPNPPGPPVPPVPPEPCTPGSFRSCPGSDGFCFSNYYMYQQCQPDGVSWSDCSCGNCASAGLIQSCTYDNSSGMQNNSSQVCESIGSVRPFDTGLYWGSCLEVPCVEGSKKSCTCGVPRAKKNNVMYAYNDFHIMSNVYYDFVNPMMLAAGSSGQSVCVNGSWSSCDCGGCTVSSVTSTPSSVVPQKTAGTTTTANVAVTLANPAPAEGCNGRLRVEPVEFSGGHQHKENRQDHTGSLNINAITFSPGEIKTSATITYTSGEVGGTEKIIAEILDGSGTVISTATGTVDVKVDGLMLLDNWLSSMVPPLISELTGTTTNHPINHYGNPITIVGIINTVYQYYLETGALLMINDMSLERGGLFEICGTWNRRDTCKNAPKGGHFYHRKGTSVDINGTASSNGKDVVVDRSKLSKIAAIFGGRIVKEGPIHYEFK